MAGRKAARRPAQARLLSREEIEDGIGKLRAQLDEIKTLDARYARHDDPAFDAAASSIRNLIRELFGPDSYEFRAHQYHDIAYGAGRRRMLRHDHGTNFAAGLSRMICLLESLISHLEERRLSLPPSLEAAPNEATYAFKVVEHICSRFHLIAQQLLRRHHSRRILEIRDEYDVQDVLHVLLRLHFDDIREEEWVPSYAGKRARVDFLLKQERIMIEAKKTRPGLGAKELGDELLIDISRYQAHHDCDTLVCLVYDPQGFVRNPRGLEGDLSGKRGRIQVKVLVVPRGS
jgi:REase_DpnII-MboI